MEIKKKAKSFIRECDNKIKKEGVKLPKKEVPVKNKEGILYQILVNSEKKKRYIRISGVEEGIVKLQIPEKIDGFPVEVIKKGAFKGNVSLKEVEMPNTIRIVGSEVFKDCKSLVSVALPPDLATINESCFEGCTSLEKVILPYSVKVISSNAFKNCSKLSILFHYVKTGIGATMKLDTSLKEDKFPSGLTHIGASAFEGCEMIESVYIPYGVTKISASVFRGCSNLRTVYFHNDLKSIEGEAFAGCSSLEIVKIPQNIKFVDKQAFDERTLVLGFDGMSEGVWENLKSVKTKVIELSKRDVNSSMVPLKENEPFIPFYNDEDLELAIKKYELRTPIEDILDRPIDDSRIISSRFKLKNDKYVSLNNTKKNTAKIVMTGDLMCRPSQINSSLFEDEYNFDDCFKEVKNLLIDSDLTIGNLESMISNSALYSNESYYVDDRVHLNAPDAYLSSVRAAGYDVVINAQNHIYDTGTRGIYETLNALNKYQLMHTGVFSSESDKRYLSIEVNGIHIAIIAYFDGSRQKMKRANFSNQGLDALFSNFDEKQIKKDIKDARNEGAEFIIAYCHWGREYTREITKKQESLAKMVADAGADYLLGSHSHCLQPYSLIETWDGRKVPVVYSAGNFMSDMSIVLPMVRDTIIVELELYRDESGKVMIKSEGYHPCLIREGKNVRGRMITIPINKVIKTASLEEQILLEEDILRISDTLGHMKRFELIVDDEVNPLKKLKLYEGSKEYQRYEVNKLPLAKQPQNISEESKNEYVFEEETGIYKRISDESVREARIICTGQIVYDSTLETDAECFGKYEFSKGFKTVANCFKDVDFTIGNFVSMASSSYPTMARFQKMDKMKEEYCNARIEFIDTLKSAGFSALAMASPYNMCTGVEGVFETEELLKEKKIIVSGIGHRKNPIVDINGIKVAFLSYTVSCINKANFISNEGALKFLNEYDSKTFKKIVEQVKTDGAEFVIVYANCGNSRNKYNLEKRKTVAEEMAEHGADYVICTVPTVISKYYKFTTSDGRVVPIATSLGSFVSGDNSDEDSILGALLKIIVRKNFDGEIEVYDNYIPLKIFKEYKGIQNAIMPAQAYFNSGYKVGDFQKVKATLRTQLGSEIKDNQERAIKMKTHYKDNFTIEELYKLLDATPSEKDLAIFGDKYQKPVSCIVSRRPDLKKDCVAFIGGFADGYQGDTVKLEIQHAVKMGAILVISEEKYDELPCIVVNKSVEKVFTDLAGIIRDKYNPLTVAITGSVGKTTTKDLMSSVFGTHYKEFHIEGNNNTIYSIRQVIQKLGVDDEVYIQEVHGGTIASASRISKLIKPNICLITSIGQAHLAQMGSMENVISGKMQIIDGLQEGGVLIINDDNEHLHVQNPDVKTVRYSSYNTNCDYYAQNIEVEEEEIYFQIVSKGGEFDAPGVYDAKLNIQGEHNVNNAVGVFAAARQANIPPHKIIAGLASYRTEGVRQNLINVGGAKLLIDVYSSNPISLLSAMKTLDALPVENGGRRIAVVGELPDQGEKSVDVHYNVGKEICEYKFDILLCIGPDSEYIVKAAKERNRVAYCFKQRETFNAVIAELIKPGDVVLFKASTRFGPMKELTIFPVFGEIS